MNIKNWRVAAAISRLDPGKPYPRASSEDASYLHQLGAAQRYDKFEPFSEDEQALNDWLSSISAGRELCRDAWDAFMVTTVAPTSLSEVEKRARGLSKRG